MRLSKLATMTMAGLLSTALYATQAQAECNSELPYDQLVDCIVVEGSGAQYNEEQETEIIETVSEYGSPEKNMISFSE